MIQLYLVFHNRIYKAIYLEFGRCSTWILGVELEEEQAKSGCAESAKCKYLIEVLHIKRLSPSVKDDGSYILHILLIWDWVCDVVERGIEGVHS